MSYALTCGFCGKDINMRRTSNRDRCYFAHLSSCSEYGNRMGRNTRRRLNPVGELCAVSNNIHSSRNDGNFPVLQENEVFEENVEEESQELCPLTFETICYYLKQRELYKKYYDSDVAQLRIGWIGTGADNVQGNSDDYVFINHFATKNNLSDAAGDDLLGIIKYFNESVILPNKFRTIREAVTKSMDEVYIFKSMKIPYDVDILRVPENIQAYASYIDPLHVLSEYFLQINEKDVLVDVLYKFNNVGCRVIDHCTNAFAYQALQRKVKLRLGNDVKVLLIDLNIDKASMDGGQRRKVAPIKCV